ncbi:hypothetical protein ACRYCC_03865 [Actinomadura scrupuli]|uniref:hypothetical protein n=1 Tax=Actinomadura scrupuli TaxID=559629 RepID=UPI003D95FBE3
MSTDTTKGREAAETPAVEVEDVEAEDVVTGEEGRPEPVAKAPARKKVRRVRVVEIIDDEDLDEVLDRLDAADEDEARPARPRPAVRTTARDAARDETDDAADDATEGAAEGAARDEADDEADEAADEPRPARTRTARKAGAPAERDGGEALGGLRHLIAAPAVRTAAAIVVIAALATFGLFQWRQASDLSARQEARRAVEAKLTEFGGVIGTYDTTRVKSSQDKIASYMVGDALSVFQANAAKAQTLTDPAKAKVTTVSKARQVIVGNVNGEFATGLIAVDITLTTEQGSAPMANNYLVVDLVKQKGVWKVSKLTPIGSPSDTTDGTGATAPAAGATPTAKPKK